MTADRSAPYGAPENIMRVIMRIRSNGLPEHLDADYLRQLGVGDGMLSRSLTSLRFLGIVDDAGVPTEFAARLQLAGEAEWPAVLEHGLRTAYDSIFRVVDPTSASRQAVADAFRPMTPQGQRDRMVTLFLGLCEAAGMPVQDPPSRRPSMVGARVRQDRPVLRARPLPRRPGEPALPVLPRPSLAVGGGSVRTLEIASGGSLTLGLTVDLLTLSKTDRDFVFGLIDMLKDYEAQHAFASGDGSAEAE